MEYVKINPKDNDVRSNYHLMISAIAPRPIALVGSIDKNNHCNLAPFSFFNGFGANPPIVGFSPALSGRTGLPKDTLNNIKEVKEFTISIVTSDIVEQTSLASSEYSADVDEYVKSGFTKHKSELIKPFGVKESPVIMECKLHSITTLGNKPASGNLILGEIIYFHISQNIVSENNKIDPYKINQVGRAGGPLYTEIQESLFSIEKPRGIGIGFDNIPKDFLESILTGNELAKISSVSIIPKMEPNKKYNVKLEVAIGYIRTYLNENKINHAWQVILNWVKYNE